MKTPSEHNSNLSDDRLNIISKIMLDLINETHDQLNTKEDSPYTRGTTVFGRIHKKLCDLGISKTYDWYVVTRTSFDLTFTIGGVPCRFFSGDPNSPKAKFFRRTEQDCLFPSNQAEVCLWRFLIEKAEQEYDEHKIHFVGFNEAQEMIVDWTYQPHLNVIAEEITDDIMQELSEVIIPESEVTPKDDPKEIPKRSEV